MKKIVFLSIILISIFFIESKSQEIYGRQIIFIDSIGREVYGGQIIRLENGVSVSGSNLHLNVNSLYHNRTPTYQQHAPTISLMSVYNIYSLTGGCALFFHHKNISYLTTIKFKDSEIGTQKKGVYDNSGVYQIGVWGNKPTGQQESYTQSSIFRMDFGIGYKVYNKNNFFVKPYLGVGITKRSSIIERYVQAEDVSSGINVLGYYWVKSDATKTDNVTPNLTFGCLMEIYGFSFGMGYDFNPNGVVLMAGCNL